MDEVGRKRDPRVRHAEDRRGGDRGERRGRVASGPAGRRRASGSTRRGGPTWGTRRRRWRSRKSERRRASSAGSSGLVALYDGLRLGFSVVPLYSLVFHCTATGATLEPHPLECADVGWFSRDALPEPLAPGAHGGGRSWLDLAFTAIAGDASEVAFDPPRDDPGAPRPTPTSEASRLRPSVGRRRSGAARRLRWWGARPGGSGLGHGSGTSSTSISSDLDDLDDLDEHVHDDEHVDEHLHDDGHRMRWHRRGARPPAAPRRHACRCPIRTAPATRRRSRWIRR